MDMQESFQQIPRPCNHPNCNPSVCLVKQPPGHPDDYPEFNMMTFVPENKDFIPEVSEVKRFSLDQEILILQAKAKNQRSFKMKEPKIQRSIPIDLPSWLYKPTPAEIIKFEIIQYGVQPFDESDQWCRKMFTWDIHTHPRRHEYNSWLRTQGDHKVQYNIRKQHKEEWTTYMKLFNCWCSFYVLYFAEQKIVQFSDKIRNMMCKPDKRKRELEEIALERQMKRLNLESSSSFPPVNALTEPAETSSGKYDWKLTDGSAVQTDTPAPPWKHCVITSDTDEYKLSPMIQETDKISSKQIIAA